MTTYGHIGAYNNASRLNTLANGGSTEMTLYNALGQRIEISGGVNGTVLYAYDEAGYLLGEYDSTGGLIEETVWLGDTPIATLRPNGSTISIFYVHSDQLNTPRQITRPSDNAPMWTWNSDPFGTDAANPNPSGAGAFSFNLRFPGQVFDGQAGLHNNYFRDFDPAIGRYVQSDPIGLLGGSYSLYVYVGSRALAAIDPSGLSPADVQKILDQFNQAVREMTASGQRMDPGWINNMIRSANDVSGGRLGHRYLGCGEQALQVQSREQNQKYDDQWTFKITGGDAPDVSADEPHIFPHVWLTATSSDPSDPRIVLGPWRNVSKTIR